MKINLFGRQFEFYNVKNHRPVVYDGLDLDCIRFRGEELPFADCDIYSILGMVSDRMANIEYSARVDYLVVNDIFNALKMQRRKIVTDLFENGYVCYSISRKMIVDVDDDRFDCGDIVKMFDDFYVTTGYTQKQELSPYLALLDTVNNADLNLLRNYGAMGVLSPENSQFQDGVFDDGDKKELQEDYTRSHGITFGKWGLMITKRPVKFSPIHMPIEALHLSDKRKEAVAGILQFINVPKELHALFESAKYANRNEAELDVYGNKINAMGNMMCRFATKIYEQVRRCDKAVNYQPNEFWFDIVNVPALQQAQMTERLAAREELRFWNEMKTAMPDRIDYINERIEDLLNRI